MLTTVRKQTFDHKVVKRDRLMFFGLSLLGFAFELKAIVALVFSLFGTKKIISSFKYWNENISNQRQFFKGVIMVIAGFGMMLLPAKNIQVQIDGLANPPVEVIARVVVMETSPFMISGQKLKVAVVQNSSSRKLQSDEKILLFHRFLHQREIKSGDVIDLKGLFLKTCNDKKLLRAEKILNSSAHAGAFKKSLYQGIFSNHKLDGEIKSFLVALVFGDKSKLTKAQRTTFSHTGTMHLFAVSGLHIICIYTMLTRFILFCLKRKNLARIISMLILVLYLDIVDYSVSSVRAYIMLLTWILSTMLYKRNSAMNTLMVSLFVILYYDYSQIQNVGFQLSFTVVLAIIWMTDHIKWKDRVLFSLLQIKTLILVSYGAFWGSALLIADYFEIFVPIALICNLLLVPFVGLLLLFSLIYIMINQFFHLSFLDLVMASLYEYVFATLNYFSNQRFSFFEIEIQLNNIIHLLYFLIMLLSFSIFKKTHYKLVFFPVCSFFLLQLNYFLN